MKFHSLILAAGLALPVASFAKEEEKEKSLTLEQVPAKVAAAITAAAGKEAVRIKAEKEDGVDAFEAKWLAGGHKHEITVATDGTVLSQEEVIPLESAPAAVQAAIKAMASSGKLESVEKVTEKDRVIYEAAFEGTESVLEVKFDANGKELKRETEKKHKKDGKEEKDDEDEDDEKE